ncbi:uncharacterized protein N7496_006219 [Penicillium cataractarum]|uniref:Potassium channel domain-containing protein n=1 Tax=Penicillium cataractarum TaxID=2100454 RepID=A0A9W9S1V5_9EURO|nr:uncharacterized protein N7496_006219 [Penicillium cataractarum]KAJ5370127.1 hypothetical protein N7496_006219 [Penicillium cataractarum]
MWPRPSTLDYYVAGRSLLAGGLSRRGFLFLREGAFCSMAIMFNICSLVNAWQQSVSADGSIVELQTPGWAAGLKATSLALSTAAYMTFILTMILHVDSITGFMVTVISWLASAIILFSLVGVEVQRHRQSQGHQTFVYTENFFAGIISASLYFLIAVLLSIYMVSLKVSPVGSADRRKIECTSIVLRVITFTILLLGGAAVYSTIEGWPLITALYFTDYTLLTIGLGNIVPQTHLGRSLLFPYAAAGITSLGFLITATASFTDQMREMKLRWKIEEARRQINNADSEKTADGLLGAERAQSQIAPVKSCILNGEEILMIHKVKSTFYRRRRWAELGFFLAAWFVLWLVSAGVFCRSEKENNWTYFVALYFTYTSLTTIGYGDYFPTSNFAKVFFIFWSLLAIPILTNLVTAIGRVLHIWLLFCSGWIWRHILRRGRPEEHHDHEYVCRSLHSSDLIATNKFPKPKPRDSRLNIESQARGQLETRQDSLSAQDTCYKRSDLGEDEQHRIIRWRTSTYYRLLLLEEIRNLISLTSVESLEHQEELCCTWSRIIPLLQAKGDTGSLSEVTPLFSSTKSEHTMMGMLKNAKNNQSERNAEISWMLNLLVEKLSSDLRKELSETID